jgi:hypothetical protein
VDRQRQTYAHRLGDPYRPGPSMAQGCRTRPRAATLYIVLLCRRCRTNGRPTDRSTSASFHISFRPSDDRNWILTPFCGVKRRHQMTGRLLSRSDTRQYTKQQLTAKINCCLSQTLCFGFQDTPPPPIQTYPVYSGVCVLCGFSVARPTSTSKDEAIKHVAIIHACFI